MTTKEKTTNRGEADTEFLDSYAELVQSNEYLKAELRKSEKPKKPKKWQLALTLIPDCILLLSGLSLMMWVFIMDKNDPLYAPVVVILLAVLAASGILTAFFFHRYFPKTTKESQYRNYLIAKLNSGQGKDFIGLMIRNNDELTEYFAISKSQAKSAFVFAIFACGIGIAMLVTAICTALIQPAAFQAALLTAIAGAITEVIAGTALVVHNKSASQMNHYYDALHENERFLSSVSLAERISEDKRDEVYIEMIRQQLSIHMPDETESKDSR